MVDDDCNPDPDPEAKGNVNMENINILEALYVEKECGIHIKSSTAPIIYRNPVTVTLDGFIVKNLV